MTQQLTDVQITADAQRAIKLTKTVLDDNPKADQVSLAAAAQTIALEVARSTVTVGAMPTVRVAGGTIDNITRVGRIDATVTVAR